MNLPFRHICYRLLSLSMFVAFLTSCQGNVDSGGGRAAKQPQTFENRVETKIDGSYEVKLNPLNSVVSPFTTSKVDITINGDSFKIKVDVKDAPVNTRISQFIYASEKCPTEVADLNTDGFIDAVEAAKVLGKIIIPIDGDLNSQLDGVEEFPVTDLAGQYSYEKEASLAKLLADLKSIDQDPMDELAKIPANEKFKLENKVFIFQGVQEEIYLPGTVHTFPGLSERATLTIACGKIRKKVEETTISNP